MVLALSTRCQLPDDDSDLHGCNVLCESAHPWGHSDRIVVADSPFTSVPAAVRLFKEGLRLIGVLKTSTKEHPMDCLSRAELPAGKGDRRALCTIDQETGARLLAFVWSDHDRRHFITMCSNTQDGEMIDRLRWRQVDRTPNADASRVHVTVRQPKACEIYYSGCSCIDRHNRSRQAGLMIEKKFKVQTFDKRINTSLFAVMVVDAHRLFAGIGKPIGIKERVFFERLSLLLIDNEHDGRNLRGRKKMSTDAELLLQEQQLNLTTSIPSCRQLIDVTPTKRHKKGHPKHLLQGRCRVCDSLSTTVCRECQAQIGPCEQNQCWTCSKPGKVCMGSHVMAHHPDMILAADDARRAIDCSRVI